MPAVSKSQQRLMAQALEVRRFIDSEGREGTDPLGIDPDFRAEILSLAKEMKKSDLSGFASTSRTPLPEKVPENNTAATVDSVNGMGPNTFPQGDAPGSGLMGFKDFVRRRRRRRKKSV